MIRVETLVLTVHILLSVTIIGLILIQHGKGADAGAFGASNSGTIFGASGSSTFLSRTTAILTTLFFITSLGLAIIAKRQTVNSNKIEVTTSAESTASTEPTMKASEPDQPVPKVDTPRPVTEKPVDVPVSSGAK